MTARRKGKPKKSNSKPRAATAGRASLKRYREKRDFARTNEPKPKPKPKGEAGTAWQFVVQKHPIDRRSLHQAKGTNAHKSQLH